MHTPVYRPHDNEFCGTIAPLADGWGAYTIFGALVHTAPDAARAQAFLVARGLALLNCHWQFYDAGTATWSNCLIQEASPQQVTIVLGYFAHPHAPTRVVDAAAYARGDRLVYEA
jgi:hypothetical protein